MSASIDEACDYLAKYREELRQMRIEARRLTAEIAAFDAEADTAVEAVPEPIEGGDTSVVNHIEDVRTSLNATQERVRRNAAK